MSCILRVSGANFPIDDFLSNTDLEPYQVYRKGERTYRRTHDESGFKIETSDKDDFNEQIADTIKYLQTNYDSLSIISKTEGVDSYVLDFSLVLRIDREKVLTQFDRFPSALLKLAGTLDFDIEISLYPPDMQTSLEENNRSSQ